MVLTDEELEEFNQKYPNEKGDRTYVHVSVGVNNPSREEVVEELGRLQVAIDSGSTRQIYPEDL